MPDHSVRYKTFWDGTETWDNPSDPNAVLLVQVVRPLVSGAVIGLRFLRAPTDDAVHLGVIRHTSTYEYQRVFLFKDWGAPASPAWQSTYFTPEYRMAANERVQIGVIFGAGDYYRILHYSDGGDVTHGNLVLDNLEEFGAPSGAFNYDILDYAYSSYLNSAYGIDLIFREDP